MVTVVPSLPDVPVVAPLSVVPLVPSLPDVPVVPSLADVPMVALLLVVSPNTVVPAVTVVCSEPVGILVFVGLVESVV